MPSTTAAAVAAQKPSEVFIPRLRNAASSIDLTVEVSTDHQWRSQSQAEGIVLKVREVLDLAFKRLDEGIHQKRNIRRLSQSKRTQYLFQYEDQKSHKRDFGLPCFIHFHGYVAFPKNVASDEHIRACWKKAAFDIRSMFVLEGLVDKTKNSPNFSSVEYQNASALSLLPNSRLGRKQSGKIGYSNKHADAKYGWNETYSEYNPHYKNVGFTFGFGSLFTKD